MSKIHLVTFATEGPPVDSGKSTLEAAEKLRGVADGWFDSFRLHTPRTLCGLDSSWNEFVGDVSTVIKLDHRFRETLPWNEDWARIGLFRWKPRLILHELVSESTGHGDIVFYHDTDVAKYPTYLKGVPHWSSWLRRRMANLDVLAFNDHDGARVWEDIKPELLAQYLPQKEVDSLEHLWAGAIAVRKTSDGINFARTWSEHASFESVSPFTKLPPPDGFNWNSCDQAVLTVLWHSEQVLPPSIRREIQPLFRSRKIPPPSKNRRFVLRIIRNFRREFRKLATAVKSKISNSCVRR